MGDVRDGAGRFRKGQTGNPGGRPRGIAAVCREIADADVLLGTLLGIVLDPQARNADRIRAAEILLDRGWGKPPTHAPVEGGDPLGQDAIDAAILDLVAQLSGRPTRTPEEN